MRVKIRVQDKRGYPYLRRDTGKPGRTSKSKRWYEPEEKLGWEADMPIKERRNAVLESKNGDLLAAARALQALAKVTTSKETKVKASADAKYFYGEYHKMRDRGYRSGEDLFGIQPLI